MTDKEAITAFKEKAPIVHKHGTDEVNYSKISALIYRLESGKLDMTVELLDKNSNCITIARPKEVYIRG